VITVVDYGMGNVGSIANMLKKVGVPSQLTADPDQIATADRLILPGVGAFDTAMQRLDDGGLTDAIRQRVLDHGVPLLGICLGMQLLADSSEEGQRSGLGVVPGRVERLQPVGPDGPLPVPHMGWSTVDVVRPHRLLEPLGVDARYYFVHSYAFRCTDADDEVGRTTYGGSFTSVVARGDVVGVQFHPEKSHRHGWALLASFAEVA